MYKMIILEDEEMVRTGLKEFIPWHELGFQLVEVFEDGKEAIEYLRSHEVEVVLTDIEMKQINGLEVAQYIYENKPETKVVILSGYRNFDYAKKAIHYNVQHYILKPTNFDEVHRIFQAIKQELDEKIEVKYKWKEEQNRYRQILPVLQDLFLADLLYGVLTDYEIIKKRARLLFLPDSLFMNPCCLFDLRLEGHSIGEGMHANDQVLDQFRKVFQIPNHNFQVYPIFSRTHDLKVLVSFLDGQGHTIINKTIEAFGQTMEASFGIKLIKKDGPLFPSLDDLILGQSLNSQDSAEEDSSPPLELIRWTKNYLLENYDKDNISLEHVANQVFLNPIYFSRLFKQQMGMNFSEYVTAIRMDKAKELLKQPHYKIYEIGEKIGYSNSKYFARVFKQNTGYSPYEYRRKQALFH